MAQSDSDLMRDPTIQRGSLFGLLNPGPRIITVPQQSERRAPVRRRLEPSASPTTVQSPAPVIQPKVNPTTFVVVMGDTLADLLAGGLDEALAGVPTAAVVKRSRADSGLVRQDFYDWGRSVRELLASAQPVTVGVMLVGANDRQPIREGEVTHEPLSDRWRELYRERVDAVVQAFAERRVPLIWVGAPPMQNARLSADLAVINEIARQRAERGGAVYVDLWPGFVDAENRYSASGPDLGGQAARLRTGDGVHFTRAGARKAAHFADVALRRLLPDLQDGPQLAAPGPVAPLVQPEQGAPTDAGARETAGMSAAAIERLIDQAARQGLGFEPLDALAVRIKPVAGPVLPLTGPALATGGTLAPLLATARPGAGSAAERLITEGLTPPPTLGRADDFRWPRQP